MISRYYETLRLACWTACASCLVALAPAQAADDVRSARVDALFAPLTEGVQPGVAVMVVDHGNVLHAAAYGYADLNDPRPLSVSTPFRLASVSKQFTSAGILWLAQAGKLAFDDPLAKYLPSLAAYDKVTLRHLMVHTGGLPEYYDLIDTSHGMPSNDDARELLAGMASPVFSPGERYEYSNPGYDMLANVVAAVSGQPFPEFMEQAILRPAGMRTAAFRDHRMLPVPDRALGYRPAESGFEPDDEDPLNGIVGSGGLYASLTDLYHWDQALYADKPLRQDTLAEAMTPARNNAGEAIDYGFGWRIEDTADCRWFRHGGSWVGFRTHIARCPARQFSIILLSNRADTEAEERVNEIAAIYLSGQAAHGDGS